MRSPAFRFSLLLTAIVLGGANLRAQDIDSLRIEAMLQSRFQQRIQHRQERWMSMIPNISTLQVAGNIGMISAGIGWDYGRNNRWETHFLLGFLPKGYNDQADVTFTLRENLIPWHYGMGRRRWAQPGNAIPWNQRARYSIEPLVFGLALSTIFNNDFWIREPEKYNDGNYYRFSSKVRAHVSVGSRFSINTIHDRHQHSLITNPLSLRQHLDRLSFYYELSTYDLAIISALPDRSITLGDILALGIGVQYKFW